MTRLVLLLRLAKRSHALVLFTRAEDIVLIAIVGESAKLLARRIGLRTQ